MWRDEGQGLFERVLEEASQEISVTSWPRE